MLQILSKFIRNLLGVMLTDCLRKVTLWKSWRHGNRAFVQTKVYDVVNSGNRNQFVVLGKSPLIAHNCTSRFCQRTGHLILLVFLWKLWRTLVERNIPYESLIWDYHDETLPIIPIEYADTLRQIYKEIWDWINNDFLKSTIKLKAEPLFASSVAGVKCDDYKEHDEDLQELLEELNNDTGH